MCSNSDPNSRLLFKNTVFSLSVRCDATLNLVELFIHGRFTHDTLYLFRKYLSHIFENEMNGHQILRINFTKIKLIDSMCFGILQELHFFLKRQGKKLQLVYLPKNMENLIKKSAIKQCLITT